MQEWICGRNPVLEVLRAGRRQVYTLQLLEGAPVKGPLVEILQLCRQSETLVEAVSRRQLDSLGHNHQGVALKADAFTYSSVEDILMNARVEAGAGRVLLLDVIQDPQNLGTLLRTAEAVQVQGVVIPQHRAASITPAVVQASSGATEYLTVARANLVSAINRLKQENYWAIGLENSPTALPPEGVRLDGRIALVVGSEGSGMRRLVRDSCDLVMRLPIRGEIGSLNAAIAGSIALYLAWSVQGYGGNS